jgi:hypothetical protein
MRCGRCSAASALIDSGAAALPDTESHDVVLVQQHAPNPNTNELPCASTLLTDCLPRIQRGSMQRSDDDDDDVDDVEAED